MRIAHNPSTRNVNDLGPLGFFPSNCVVGGRRIFYRVNNADELSFLSADLQIKSLKGAKSEKCKHKTTVAFSQLNTLSKTY